MAVRRASGSYMSNDQHLTATALPFAPQAWFNGECVDEFAGADPNKLKALIEK